MQHSPIRPQRFLITPDTAERGLNSSCQPYQWFQVMDRLIHVFAGLRWQGKRAALYLSTLCVLFKQHVCAVVDSCQGEWRKRVGGRREESSRRQSKRSWVSHLWPSLETFVPLSSFFVISDFLKWCIFHNNRWNFPGQVTLVKLISVGVITCVFQCVFMKGAQTQTREPRKMKQNKIKLGSCQI